MLFHGGKGLADMKKCSLCNGTNCRPFEKEQREGIWYEVVYCPDCDLIQTVDPVSAVSPTYIDLTDDAIDADRLWVQDQHKHPAFVQWQQLVGPLQMEGKHGRLLDIGCGTGGFLRFAKKQGFETYGFDASNAQAEYAGKELPNVRCAISVNDYLSQLDHPDLRFDVITLWDVLEHIREPREFLGQLKSVLSEDGVFFCSVPNGGALWWKLPVRRLFGKGSELIPWEHVFYYSPSSLRRCLEDVGLVIQKTGAVVCYPRPLSLFEILRRIGFVPLKNLPRLAPQIFAVARLGKG